MDGQSENLREPRPEPVAAGLAPLEELETDEVPDSMTAGRFFRLVDEKGRELVIGDCTAQAARTSSRH
jgi:hypothetical protein